jgi:hypothetical protein
MALQDNVVAQVQPVLILGSINAQGGVTAGGGISNRQYSTVTNTLIVTNGQAFTIPAGGKALVQCWDDEPVFVNLGPGVTTSNASFILAAGTAATDGKGGSYMIDDYAGVVTVTAAGTVRVNVALYS